MEDLASDLQALFNSYMRYWYDKLDIFNKLSPFMCRSTKTIFKGQSFFFTFIKHFSQLQKIKIYIYSVPLTIISTKNVKVLIWSTYFQQWTKNYISFNKSIFKDLTTFFNTFINHFLQLHIWDNISIQWNPMIQMNILIRIT